MRVSIQFVFAFLLALGAQATPTTITDTTPGGATVDGTINGGEYIGFNTGVNSGFGNVWGSSSTLSIDSDSSGNIQFGLSSTGVFNNVAVVYIDNGKGGGVADTTVLADNADAGRAAISGDGTGGDFSDLFFNDSNFQPTHAIAWDGAANVNLFSISANNPHTFVAGASPNVSGVEVQFTLGQIGLVSGDSFNFIVTYLDASNGYRSNEGMGFNAGNPAPNDANGNPGNNGAFSTASQMFLTTGEYSTFNSIIPEPGTLTLLISGLLALGICRRFR